MKRVWLITCLTICISFALSARDIKTKSGQEFKNVTITSVTPTGIDISFQKNQISFIKHIMFSDLSKETQKEFGYDPKKAEAYLENLKKHAEMVEKKYTETLAKDKSISEKQQQIKSQIEAGAINVLLKVTDVKPDGLIGWGNVISPVVHSTGHMGKIFIYGLLGMSGSVQARIVYPTGQFKYGCPVYAGTLEQALILKENASK